MRLRFSNLPLVETAARLTIEPALDVSVALAAQVYRHVAEEYPALEDSSVFEQPPGMSMGEFAKDLVPMMGFRTANVKTGLGLTFQRRLLSSRWTSNQLKPAYGGFESLLKGLELGMSALASAGVPPPQATVANVLYVNFIAGDTTAIDRLLAMKAPVEAFATARTKQRLLASWQEQSGSDLTIDLQSATLNAGEERQEGYQITTIAGTRELNPEKPIEALWQLHDRLQELFLDLITPDAHTEWGLKIEN